MPPALDADYDKLYQHLRTEASKFQETLVAQQIDVLITPTWLGFAPIYGNPSLCLPMGYLNGKPKGIILVGKLGNDQALLHLGHKFYDIESI
jgi:Asp-tRNA(Asn)/Glu-tRNA(Gln) amidotransferase A subunit family amidase